MSTVEAKLRRGFGLLARASSDSDLMGVALLAIHSALEEHMRGALASTPAVAEDDRQRLIRRELSWAALADLAQRHLALADTELQLVLDAQHVRRGFIQGRPFAWRAADMLRYGRFVAVFCGAEGMLDELTKARRTAERAREQPPEPAEPAPSWNRDMLRLAIMVAVSGMLCAGVFATYQWVGQALRELDAPTVPQAAATAGALPTAIPGRTGTLVNLGGGPGWLHEQPSFDSATMPPRLAEGDRLRIIDEPTVEADGTIWQLVEAQGYRGWSPLNNVRADARP
ncbi:hypothetical protein F8S13_13085 [Chloroflexia bacterium SDU3-3]|nr:hypothetical protein F8S13_13085 [Chloroflexia bacterium SDU3-3]